MPDKRQQQDILYVCDIEKHYLNNYYSYSKEKDYANFINAKAFSENVFKFAIDKIFDGNNPFTKLQEEFLKRTFEKMYNQPETVQHLITTMFLAKHISNEIEKIYNFEKEFNMSKTDFIFALGIHDVGKMVIPPEVLLSKEKFYENSEEKKMINSHSYYGEYVLDFIWEDIKKDLNQMLEEKNTRIQAFELIGAKKKQSFEDRLEELEKCDKDVLFKELYGNKGVVEIIKNHHESVVRNPIDKDTFKYCKGIILSQMIDVLDALVQERCYKNKQSIEKAISIFKEKVQNEIRISTTIDARSVLKQDESKSLLADLNETSRQILNALDLRKSLLQREELEKHFTMNFEKDLNRGKEVIDRNNNVKEECI